jgi:chemotaxis protein methyltransferase CheR
MWSAAAATGQEAYSLAILMADEFPDAPSPAILATDVSRGALQRARDGTYTQLEVNRGLPARSLVRHFTQQGRMWQIKPALHRTVRCEYLNLSQPWPRLPAMDVIMLRNVLIYLDEAARASVLQRAIEVLAPGGYLILGSAETLLVRSDRVDRVEVGRTICFRASNQTE